MLFSGFGISSLFGKRSSFPLLLIVLLSSFQLMSGNLFAAEPVSGGIDTGDTAWVLVSTAMVMFMTPGLALFYAGMARRKNVLGTMMHSYILLSLLSLQWIFFGYSLSFGSDISGLVGGVDYFGLAGVGVEANGTIPHLLFMAFQGMFAVITVALITGGVAERVKFSAILLFSVIWATVVYDPLCHWVWGGGWMAKMGVLDFAGGIVVHISCGVAALVAAVVVGKRRGWPTELMPPHNLTLTLMGMGILWFGWFGFNSGSALGANGTAVIAFVNTNVAAAAGTLAWTAIEWYKGGKPTLLGAMSGTVAGLGSVTPAAGFVTPAAAVIIGLVAGALCYWTVTVLKMRLRYDDTLDVFGIHGIAGTWGTIATGIFASVGAKGLLAGNPRQLMVQVIAAVATVCFTALLTYLILKFVDLTIGLRVEAEAEFEGLDLSEHGESGYIL